MVGCNNETHVFQSILCELIYLDIVIENASKNNLIDR